MLVVSGWATQSSVEATHSAEDQLFRTVHDVKEWLEVSLNWNICSAGAGNNTDMKVCVLGCFNFGWFCYCGAPE